MVSNTSGTLVVSAFDDDIKGEMAGFLLDTDTGEYNAVVLPEDPQGSTPTALPLIRGHQLSLE